MRSFKSLLSSVVAVALLFVASTLSAAEDKSAKTFSWQDDPQAGTTDLKYGDQPVVRYMHAYDTSTEKRAHETFKVFHHVFGPGSEDIITKGPHGKFTHHRGIFFGFNKTQFEGQELDFWHCKKGEHQRHIGFQELAADEKQARMIAEIHWIDREGKPVIIEARDFTFRPLSGDLKGKGFQIDFESTLTSKRGSITLTGDRQHAGFQIRAAQEIAETDGARYVRPAGFPEQAEAFQANDKTEPNKHIDLGWFAMTYELNGRRYTFEYFEDPSMPKPSRFSERPYGRFGAFFTAKVSEDQPLQVRYRVNVITGETPTREEIQQRYDQFVAELAKGK
ncbi:hypothetical protein Mal52_60510 [Symmachiella dynata]|uniref:Methane oxygenase PmoA n=1 Tax=Symmachiella dynata TaxID=2527995 RepID=A0A517ZYG8_9PLAN|nr:DUF6807 family protein [Symmachiella dynata]QDU47519.1 hypothetical protein Mal52_60510 [Symmachiella dynata]